MIISLFFYFFIMEETNFNYQIFYGKRIENNLFKEYSTGEVHKILVTRFSQFDEDKLVFIKGIFEYNVFVVEDFVYAEDEG